MWFTFDRICVMLLRAIIEYIIIEPLGVSSEIMIIIIGSLSTDFCVSSHDNKCCFSTTDLFTYVFILT